MDETSGQLEKEQRFRKWIDEYRTILLRICLVYLADPALAEDAVQETYLKAWKAMDSFEARNGCSEKTWLTSIAINTCKSCLRNRWFRHVDTHKDIEDMLSHITDVPIEQRELFIDITRLPEKYKSVILLHYYQRMTHQEIAEALGISRSLVKYRLKRALEALRIETREEECI